MNSHRLKRYGKQAAFKSKFYTKLGRKKYSTEKPVSKKPNLSRRSQGRKWDSSRIIYEGRKGKRVLTPFIKTGHTIEDGPFTWAPPPPPTTLQMKWGSIQLGPVSYITHSRPAYGNAFGLTRRSSLYTALAEPRTVHLVFRAEIDRHAARMSPVGGALLTLISSPLSCA